MAASAGGLAAISTVLGALPEAFPVPVLVVQHLDPRHISRMADILRRRTPLQVEDATDGATAEPATVYIAPPDEHLLVNPGAGSACRIRSWSTSSGPPPTSSSSPVPVPSPVESSGSC